MDIKDSVTIRTATTADAQALLNIYAPYVEHTAITFEYDVPSAEEFASRIEYTLQKYPYLVAEENKRLLGYAYASPFHARPAYDWAVETSIYVNQNVKHRGIGRKLHDALENALREQGILNMNACIAYPPKEDEYLDKNSVEFHHHMGYRLVGEFYKCGYKFHRWYNMVWMEKLIGRTILSNQKTSKLAKRFIIKNQGIGLVFFPCLISNLFSSFFNESSKSPASIAKSNKQWVGTYLYQEGLVPLLINCEAVIRL